MQSKVERMSPIGKHLLKIRFDDDGKPLKRTLWGTSDEYIRPKQLRSERGFSLRKLKDEYICKPRIIPVKQNKKLKTAKVVFNTNFNQGKGSKNKEDPNKKTISVMNSDGTFSRVFGHRFSDENLDTYIQDYLRRKKYDDETENYTSLFHTTLSSIKSMKNWPQEFTHNIDREERYLKNYEKIRKIWHSKAVNLSKMLHKEKPEETLMRSSDTFSEYQVLKSGSLMKKSDYNKKLSQRDFNVCTKPNELEIFKDHKLVHPCLRHIRRSTDNIKAIKFLEKIESFKDLIVKGNNKFEAEIEFVKSIPESNRFIIKKYQQNGNENEENEEIDDPPQNNEAEYEETQDDF